MVGDLMSGVGDGDGEATAGLEVVVVDRSSIVRSCAAVLLCAPAGSSKPWARAWQLGETSRLAQCSVWERGAGGRCAGTAEGRVSLYGLGESER